MCVGEGVSRKSNDELVKHCFFDVSPMTTLSKLVSVFKNHYQLTFATIECFLRLMWPPRLLLQLDMIICKLPKTYIMSGKHVKKILEVTEVAMTIL